ncbi:hypothetical protein EYF80_037631 [Liparis tanakae]|uniref:Uncharacterized protein n=1 Tax=Liparis tanakae TaxID=230148 RepID=A0A4Z2GFH5_9TELE|nr:hypothetical protein EYF80_037631 [Liparis tanakae]
MFFSKSSMRVLISSKLSFSQRKERADPEEEQDRRTELLNSINCVWFEVTTTVETELPFSQEKEGEDPEEEQDRRTELLLDSNISVVLAFTFTLDTETRDDGELTVDGEVYWITGAIADGIKHRAPEGSLVVTSHIDYRESGASVSELNSLTGCDLRAAVEPGERGRGSRGGAGQTDGAVELHQV